MRNIPDSKISYYGRNRRVFLSNPRYKSDSRVKTKPTFNQLIKETYNQFIEKWGTFMEVNDPALYESMTGIKARKPVVEVSKPIEEVKKTDAKWYVHVDEDCFIESKQEVLNLLQKMEEVGMKKDHLMLFNQYLIENKEEKEAISLLITKPMPEVLFLGKEKKQVKKELLKLFS